MQDLKGFQWLQHGCCVTLHRLEGRWCVNIDDSVRSIDKGWSRWVDFRGWKGAGRGEGGRLGNEGDMVEGVPDIVSSYHRSKTRKRPTLCYKDAVGIGPHARCNRRWTDSESKHRRAEFLHVCECECVCVCVCVCVCMYGRA